MKDHKGYSPGPAEGAEVRKTDGENWTLVLVRKLPHSRDKVWQALTDPDELRQWSPFDADGNLGVAGNSVKLTTVGAPSQGVTITRVKHAEEPSLLVYDWGGSDVRWELEAEGDGTRLTLWTSINRRYIAMGAAGWHVCIDVMDHLLAGEPVGRIVAGEALQFEGWQRLYSEYSTMFGVAPAGPSPLES